MVRRFALVFLGCASPLLLVLALVPAEYSGIAFMSLAMAFPVALIVLSTADRETVGPMALPLVALLAIMEGGGLGLFLFRGEVESAPWIGGLPMGAAILLYGLWVAPLVLVVAAYAATFDRFVLRSEDLERLAALRREGEGRR